MKFQGNSKVTHGKIGFVADEFTYDSVSLGVKAALTRKQNKNEYVSEQARYNNIEKNYAIREQQSMIVDHMLESTRALQNNSDLYKKGKELVFKNIILDMLYESLYLDNEFKAGLKESLYDVVSNYIDERGGYGLLESAVIKTKSPYLSKLKSICEKTTKGTCKRKIKEADESIDFSLTPEEEEEFELDKSELNIESLSKVVKEKVLNVVKDEKEREKKEAELIKELSDETDMTEDEVEEAMRVSDTTNINVYEATLFNALFRDSYSQYITEGAGSEDFDINMDVVLAEAITKYTLLEVFHTIGLENLSSSEIHKKIQRMLNK